MTRYISNLIIFSLVSAAYLFGAFEPIERKIMDLRFELSQRDASGGLVIVEIDSRSLRELDTWPWPRGHHAQLIDRLRAAGAEEIALDVDFSSRSSPQEDAKLVAALQRAEGRVILPAFRQRMRNDSGSVSIVESQPLDILARHSRRGLVNVEIESDGLVRWYATHDIWKGLEIDRLAAALSRTEKRRGKSFLIDFGIRPETIPRLSYVDVLRGQVDPRAISGKAVMVGATSVELGDSFAVPVYRVLPGVVVQALAHESLVQDRTLQPLPPAVTLCIGLLLALGIGTRFAGWSWRKGLLVVGVTVVGVIGISALMQMALPVAMATTPLIMIPLCSYAAGLWRVIDVQELAIFRQRLDLAHRRAMMQAVVDDSFDGIVIANQDGVIELLNPAAERMLKVKAGEAIGTPVHSLIPSNREIAHLYGRRSGGDDPPAAVNVVGPQEFTLAANDSSEIVIEMVVSSSHLSMNQSRRRGQRVDEAVQIYTFRNVTERRMAEDAQRRALEEHAAASRAKTEFVANMSHELRTPLNAIIGFSEILKMEALGPVGNPQYVEYVSDIHDSGTHLLAVINDILDISQIESGQMQLNESIVDISRIVSSCMRLFEERIDHEKIRLSKDIPDNLPCLWADERKVKQIIYNLLSNAVKFTPVGKVTVRCNIDCNGALVLSVDDTGIGIAPDDMETALQSFGQIDSRLQRKYEGTGLGLSIVNALAALHDAKFKLESVLGAGTAATVHFPVERAVPKENHKGVRESESPKLAIRSGENLASLD